MKQRSNDTTGLFDTIELNEANESAAKVGFTKVLKQYIGHGMKKMRMSFSKSCDSSFLSNMLDRLYFGILGCSMKAIATFLLSFSFISLLISYFDSVNLRMFMLSTNTLSVVILIFLSLIFFTTKKSLGDVISSSTIAFPLSIVYNQQNIYLSNTSQNRKSEGYSTAFFLGVLTGISSIVFPPSAIIVFILSAVYCVFIFGRPECGLLFSIFAIPFFNEVAVIFLSLFTFISLVYKYLRGKRHIDFGVMQIMMIAAMVYIVIRFAYTDKSIVDYNQLFNFLSFFLVCITSISLTRTTAILLRSIKIIMNISRIYALILICYLVLCSVFSVETTGNYLSNFALSGLMTSLTSQRFIIPFLAIVFPLNFSLVVSGEKSQQKIRNIVFLVILILITTYYASYEFILTIFVFSLLNVIFVKPKLFFLLIPCPAIAFGIMKLHDLIPSKFMISASSTPNSNVAEIFDRIKTSLVFGSGLERIENSSLGSINSSFVNILSHIGAFGVLLLAVIIVFMIYKSFSSIYRSSIRIESARTVATGLVCSSMSLIVSTIYCDGLSDYRIVFMFAIVMSLAYSAGRCYDADYIDSTSVREYHQF